MAEGTIQNILTDLNNDIYVEGANNFNEEVLIIDNDIQIITDQHALWDGIQGCIKTPLGVIDGVGLERYGCRFLQLRGQQLNNLLIELGITYIREDVLPQFVDYVYDFTDITINQDDRFTIGVHIEVDSIFGPFKRSTYI